MLNSLSNDKKQKGELKIIKINDQNYILIGEYEHRQNEFFDVMFKNNNKEIFLGRFSKEFNRVSAKYNNGRILIYSEELINNEYVMTSVLSLYDIIDDTFYSLTEEDAIKLFDPNMELSLIHKNKCLIARQDIAKRQKVKNMY